ncbi:AAA family ATPase [Streptomyces sp. PSKA28]|uniref:AAA family ATPase n=1 Tax=Streptomyces himalayensis subsp. himalayensis TaxID=2756131 RepID=A0A7W0DSN3_9ACTN|nr:AAA family ATPase [Streptomyces himalayensis subsp. himalayensis]
MGRQAECGQLDRLLAAVRAGESRSLVVRGEAGVGKSALLEHLTKTASDCRVVGAAGVQSEMELAFAAVHQLCVPLLDRLDDLPEPQRDALGTAFGMRAGPAPDPFLVSLAVLSLLAAAAEDRPLVCVIDDAQWLDRASVQVLAFVARRLFAESVACVFAVRESGEADAADGLSGLPVMEVAGLRDDDAHALLSTVVLGQMDDQVRDQIITEARGNPLALLELPRDLPSLKLAGGFVAPAARTLSGRIEKSFQRRLERLPADTRQLLLLAAAEPLGDPVLLWRAADLLEDGVGIAAADAAEDMIDVGDRVRFRHPLVRSAVYRAASPEQRRSVHHALAEATDIEADPDRHAWHRAHGTAQPDEWTAAELEHSAARAQARGGLAAAAAFLERAAALTPDPGRRAERALAAAQATHQAGAPDNALKLLSIAAAGPVDDRRRGRIELLRAQIAFSMDRGRDSFALLLKAARRLQPYDPPLARETYLEAINAALFAGPLADNGQLKVAKAALSAPGTTGAPRPADLLLDGLTTLISDGYGAGVPSLQPALSAFTDPDLSPEQGLRWLWLAGTTAATVWDYETWDVLATRHIQLVRESGDAAMLPFALTALVAVNMIAGELGRAASLLEEVKTVCEAIGIAYPVHGFLLTAAGQGRQTDHDEMMGTVVAEATRRGEGSALIVSGWTTALLCNSRGRYEDALVAARQTTDHPQRETSAALGWALVEEVEAAARSGALDRAADAFRRLSERTGPSGTSWALGVQARSRALISSGADAEDHYREAIDRLGPTRIRGELARAHLVYGEWLRRERRRSQAREQLRTAHEMFTAMGMEAFADRAARELRATGETARKRSVETTGQLTPQESQIARLAREGLTNKEIAGRLYLSTRTVEYHLHKVFAKLGITSRNQLGRDAFRDL